MSIFLLEAEIVSKGVGISPPTSFLHEGWSLQSPALTTLPTLTLGYDVVFSSAPHFTTPPDHTTYVQITDCSMRSREPSIFFLFGWRRWIWHLENDRAGSRIWRSCLLFRLWPSDRGKTNLSLSSPLPPPFIIKHKECRWAEIFCELVLVTAHNFLIRKSLELLNSHKSPFSCFKMKYIDIFL